MEPSRRHRATPPQPRLALRARQVVLRSVGLWKSSLNIRGNRNHRTNDGIRHLACEAVAEASRIERHCNVSTEPRRSKNPLSRLRRLLRLTEETLNLLRSVINFHVEQHLAERGAGAARIAGDPVIDARRRPLGL